MNVRDHQQKIRISCKILEQQNGISKISTLCTWGVYAIVNAYM